MSQTNCPLFSLLPADVREDIFSYALTDYPDPDKRYSPETCYTRPSYFAPSRTDTALLRTCRAVYAETWHLPIVLREQVHYLTAPNRSPPDYPGLAGLSRLSRRLTRHSKTEIAGLRVFAQMWKLEQGSLNTVLASLGLFPKALTVTIRHTDWWYWENDVPLRFEADWIRQASNVLPDSVREICMELESTVRRKDQIDAIVRQMGERWFFVRKDGVVLYPDATGKACEVSGWRGKSTWHGERWERDETEPGFIDYYVVSVPFRFEYAVERRGGRVHDAVKSAAGGHRLNADSMRLDVREEVAHQEEQRSETASPADLAWDTD